MQSFNLVSSAILPGVDHAGRSFLSLAATLRYVGLDEEVALQIRSMIPPALIDRAQIIGAALRVASVLAAGMPDVLPRAAMTASKGKVAVALPPDLADLSTERLVNRVKALAKLLGREPAMLVS